MDESIESVVSRDVPEVDVFLRQLDTRWSLDACSSLLRTVERSEDMFTTFDKQICLLREVSRQVDAKIAELIPRVCITRNRFCRINNLPTELLEGILLLACGNGLHSKMIINVTKTCKTWYSLISRNPRAYSAISLCRSSRSFELAELFAERSHPMTLSVAWGIKSESHGGRRTRAWESNFCIQHISRIANLEFGLPQRSVDRWLLDLPARRLRSCKLVSHQAAQDRRGLVDEVEVKRDVFPQLLGGDTPLLRRLELRDRRLAWTPGNYKNLPSLTLGFTVHNIGRTELDVDDFTIIFEESPGLVHLALHTHAFVGQDDPWNYEGWDPNTHRPRRARQYMPCLRNLSVISPVEFVLCVLSAIVIPDTIESVIIESKFHAKSSLDPFTPFRDDSMIPSFLFENLESLRFPYRPACGAQKVVGAGQRHCHKYSFNISLPCDPLFPVVHEVSSRPMPCLKSVTLLAEELHRLPHLLARCPSLTSVDVIDLPEDDAEDIVAPATIDEEDQSLLSQVTRWSFTPKRPFRLSDMRIRIPSANIEFLKALSRLPSHRLEPLVIHGTIEAVTSVETIREFVIDLARSRVALDRRCKFVVATRDEMSIWPFDDCPMNFHRIHYDSVESLWPQGVPEEVKRVMDIHARS